MPVITTSQEPSWDSNVYVIVTTRIFVLIGAAYLVRSLYNLVSPSWGSRLASIAAATMSGLGLEAINLDTSPTAPGAVATDPELEANLTPSVQHPHYGQDSREHIQSSQASHRAQEHGAGTPESHIAANAMPEQDVGVRHGTQHVDEEVGLSVQIGG